MRQEDKELLLKDLCARLPYKVKASYYGAEEEMQMYDEVEGVCGDYVEIGQYSLPIEAIKPYLFPLSSMTEEQKNECFDGTPLELDKYGDVSVKDDSCGNCLYTDLEIYLKVIDWLLKNHFDIYGLIEKGLAIDATGLNIYKEETK